MRQLSKQQNTHCATQAQMLDFIFKQCIQCTMDRDSVVGIIATGWTVRESKPGAGEIFRTRPDRLWGPSILVYNGYRVTGSHSRG